MVVLGGVTRLTDSGLSITEWKPLVGVVPPLTEQQWEEEFDKYKQFPEFKKYVLTFFFQFPGCQLSNTEIRLNSNMTLSEFKYIFFFEWAHRVLGRGIGVAFGLPLAFFMYRGWVTKSLRTRLLTLFGLGGLQGAIGWWMVKSGLKEDLDHPRVSAYRLVYLNLGTSVTKAYSGWLHILALLS